MQTKEWKKSGNGKVSMPIVESAIPCAFVLRGKATPVSGHSTAKPGARQKEQENQDRQPKLWHKRIPVIPADQCAQYQICEQHEQIRNSASLQIITEKSQKIIHPATSSNIPSSDFPFSSRSLSAGPDSVAARNASTLDSPTRSVAENTPMSARSSLCARPSCSSRAGDTPLRKRRPPVASSCRA